MTEESQTPGPKIFVDEDWKSSRVSRARRRATPTSEAPKAAKPEEERALPPPSLSLLANSLYLQASISLGFIPSPLSGKAEVNLAHAKHTIDTLAVLQQKPRGTARPEEDNLRGNVASVAHGLFVGGEGRSLSRGVQSLRRLVRAMPAIGIQPLPHCG